MNIRKNKQQIEVITERGSILIGNNQVVIKRKHNDEKYPITEPGEYDVEGITVFAQNPFPSYLIDVEGINISYLPISAQDLSNAKEASYGTLFEQTDILVINGKDHELVNQLSPSYVVPTSEEKALSEKLSIEVPEPVKSINVKSSSDLPEKTELIILKG